MRTASLTAIVTATALSLTPAWAAAEPRAGVLPLDVEGQLPPNGGAAISAEIDAGLHEAGATVVSTAELSTASGAALSSCRDAACLKDVAGKASVQQLVRVSVKMEESDYVIALELVDGATGQVVHQASETCELCGLTEAQAKARTLAASLADRLIAGGDTGKIAVQSTPAGAEVLVDGQPAGTAPLELDLPAGEHVIVLRLAGYADDERRVVVEAGAAAAVAVDLSPSAPGEDEGDEPDRSALLRPIGWASLGVGVAALGAGIALLAIDENPVKYTRCTGVDVDVEGNCRFRYSTLGGGVVMTIVGVVGIAAGALLVARTYKQGKGDERRARVRPTLRGFAIQF
jgi:hypothetical protein